nr:YceI family protein [Arenimonas daejeonensis]
MAGVSANAAEYTVQPGSTLGFSATYQGEAFEGRFADFTPAISFDPEDLAGSRFEVHIELASAGTDNDERDELLLGEGFFDSGTVAQAVYLADAFRALGGDRYVADGVLTLRGISRQVPLAFTWTAGAEPVLEGEARLSRLAFKVGEGEWADTDLLPDEVVVTTRLVLAPRE